jgi:hypothetical protein
MPSVSFIWICVCIFLCWWDRRKLFSSWVLPRWRFKLLPFVLWRRVVMGGYPPEPQHHNIFPTVYARTSDVNHVILHRVRPQSVLHWWPKNSSPHECHIWVRIWLNCTPLVVDLSSWGVTDLCPRVIGSESQKQYHFSQLRALKCSHFLRGISEMIFSDRPLSSHSSSPPVINSSSSYSYSSLNNSADKGRYNPILTEDFAAVSLTRSDKNHRRVSPFSYTYIENLHEEYYLLWHNVMYLVEDYRRFGGTYRLHLQAKISWAKYQSESNWQATLFDRT